MTLKDNLKSIFKIILKVETCISMYVQKYCYGSILTDTNPVLTITYPIHYKNGNLFLYHLLNC